MGVTRNEKNGRVGIILVLILRTKETERRVRVLVFLPRVRREEREAELKCFRCKRDKVCERERKCEKYCVQVLTMRKREED